MNKKSQLGTIRNGHFLHPKYGWLPLRLLTFWNIVRGKELPPPKNYAVITKKQIEEELTKNNE